MKENINLIGKTSFSFKNENIINTLRSNGRSKNPEDINLLEIFLDKYEQQPKLYRIFSNNDYYDWDILKNKLKEKYKDAEIIFTDTYFDVNKNIYYNKQETWVLRDGLILHMEGGIPDDYYLINYDLKNVNRLCSLNLFLIKDEFNEKEDLNEMFKESLIDKIDVVSIGMVSVDEAGFYIKDFDIMQKTSNLTLLDEHYGDGFDEFFDKLLKKLSKETKGLTLFHGKPGTGKTTVIRYLLRKLKEINKDNNILYFPPTMVHSITDPGFINFISDWVSDSKGKNYLLIEDAEPLLESRDQSRNMGITNLLNMTDGLLNDILNIQIIATFNTDLSNIDNALLRPERLIARKEFTTLTVEEGKKLAKLIDINEDLIKNDMTLADIYSIKKESKTITHNITSNKNKIGFNNKK